MSIYRVFADSEGESHIEELDLGEHPTVRSFMNISEAGIHKFQDLRSMDFHPLPERRLFIHLNGEVKIGVSDGGSQIFRPGDARLMEDTSGKGHTHQDLTPVIQAVIVLTD